MEATPQSDDITLHCKVRRGQQLHLQHADEKDEENEEHLLMGQPTSDMLLTLRQWHNHETLDSSSSGHEVLFVGQDYFDTTITTAVPPPPMLWLHSLPHVPSKVRNHRSRRRRRRPQRCSSPSSTSSTQNEDAVVEESNADNNESTTTTSFSVSLNDIEMATLLPDSHYVRLLLSPSSLSEEQLQLGDSCYDVLEIFCLSRNAVYLLGATLQSRLPSTRWQQRQQQNSEGGVPQSTSYKSIEGESNSQSSAVPSISPCSSSHSSLASALNDKTYSVDTLTAACMQATAAQESLSQKLERRWGKAVHEWTQLVGGGAKEEGKSANV